MRIQTRLFLGTALPLLALVGAQWWLHQRQVRSLERELGVVATSVGRDVLAESLELLAPVMEVAPPGGAPGGGGMAWVAKGRAEGGVGSEGVKGVDVVIVSASNLPVKVERREVAAPGGTDRSLEPEGGHREGQADPGAGDRRVVRYRYELREENDVAKAGAAGEGMTEREETLHVEVGVAPEGTPGERYLVVRAAPVGEKRVPIPVLPTRKVVSSTLHQGLAFGMGLLAVGLVTSGVLARRLARPLEQLASSAETLGRGQLGVQVPLSAAGEVGELQRAFNRMSRRLAELERERDAWRQREHLAELGDLARGLAHTLRNPLNTLGLATEELATSAGGEGEQLATTARAQIRRIDRWLRSFLALGAGGAARPEPTDLEAVVQEAVLEAVQQGAGVDMQSDGAGVQVTVVPTALRAALANLLENAVQASPAGDPVEVRVTVEGGTAAVRITDRGPGLPEEVRQRLFQPHVTTRAGGSGMGLFLARQLVVASNGGTLEVADGDEGGTVVTVSLPVTGGGEGADDAG